METHGCKQTSTPSTVFPVLSCYGESKPASPPLKPHAPLPRFPNCIPIVPCQENDEDATGAEAKAWARQNQQETASDQRSLYSFQD